MDLFEWDRVQAFTHESTDWIRHQGISEQEKRNSNEAWLKSGFLLGLDIGVWAYHHLLLPQKLFFIYKQTLLVPQVAVILY